MFIQDALVLTAFSSTSPAICLTKFELVMNLKTGQGHQAEHSGTFSVAR